MDNIIETMNREVVGAAIVADRVLNDTGASDWTDINVLEQGLTPQNFEFIHILANHFSAGQLNVILIRPKFNDWMVHVATNDNAQLQRALNRVHN